MWSYSPVTELSSPEFLEPPQSQSVPMINDIPIPNFEMDDFSQVQENVPQGPIPISSNSYVVPSITVDIAAQIIKGNYKKFFEQVIVVDCRYKYEYDGGHICHAINLITYEKLLELYQKYQKVKTCFIFHCEYSTNRGPTWTSIFRDIDRTRNKMIYPKLTFEHVYLIEGGYKAFYSKYESLCSGGYTSMEQDGSLDLSNLKKAKRIYKSEIQKHHGPRTPQVHRRPAEIKASHNILRSVSFSQNL
ncbi:Rhodanese-like domain containing protein [Trichomonas vaginalis G3]|uniref:protein-tyrosine-phosphatase n=1 Tax=Trichomonas vaginalis (strain ATCC PRA-98 / G3) TaxID=412133 RepID=A2FUQ7_TRIV3|nr:positive regulation of cell cycle G2/M phase transition [Trichomonas vaginalis G3]EAX91346.1 Rhodanese-like domain containing protein [Trichomonas vaginalis G3]KAI5504244.1 positive regulation of cell cycle G2/M phase transition [Trichomonas vaginalis G3]|eukprot:XP_001304276.1 Rhodanese-like domain containing protein [Trichomonas vaginalis G3]